MENQISADSLVNQKIKMDAEARESINKSRRKAGKGKRGILKSQSKGSHSVENRVGIDRRRKYSI